MIPKVIHYCWFGQNPKPDFVLQCIQTWKDKMPDYKIKEWNESNFDVEMMPYTSEAYFAKKYAFVSDVARLYALVTEGGLYLDTDMIFLKPLPDSFLQVPAFAGIESEKYVATSLLASIPNHPIFSIFLSNYKKCHYFELFRFSRQTNVHKLQKLLFEKGFIPYNKEQYFADLKIYPQEYFCNKDYKTGSYYNTDISYAIHDFSGTWNDCSRTKMQKIRNRFNQISTILEYNLLRRLK